MLAHQASILAAEAARLVGAPMLTQEALDAKVEVLLDGSKSIIQGCPYKEKSNI